MARQGIRSVGQVVRRRTKYVATSPRTWMVRSAIVSARASSEPPLLATVAMHGDGHHGSTLFDIGSLPGYLRILVTLLAILSIFF